MAISRRGILGALAGVTAAPAAISMNATATALGVPLGASVNDLAIGAAEGTLGEAVGRPAVPSSRQSRLSNAINITTAASYAKANPENWPEHIRSKRSWSGAFKAGEAAKEAALREAVQQLSWQHGQLSEAVLEGLLTKITGVKL